MRKYFVPSLLLGFLVLPAISHAAIVHGNPNILVNANNGPIENTFYFRGFERTGLKISIRTEAEIEYKQIYDIESLGGTNFLQVFDLPTGTYKLFTTQTASGQVKNDASFGEKGILAESILAADTALDSLSPENDTSSTYIPVLLGNA